jgi:hypothetical protein
MKGLILFILLLGSTYSIGMELTAEDKQQWTEELDRRIVALAKLKACVKKVKRKQDLEPCGVKSVKDLLEFNSPDNIIMKEVNRYQE